MSLNVASPIIVFVKEQTTAVELNIKDLRANLNKVRLRSFGSIKIYRTPDENGKFNVGGLNNKLHRCGVHMSYYFTNPVLVNYDNSLNDEDIEGIITNLRYVDCSRIHIVHMATDGSYKLDLKINQNLSFNTFKDIDVTPALIVKGSS